MTTVRFDPPLDTTASVYRRRILVVEEAPGVIVSDLADDFHHFTVTLRHDDTTVLSVEAASHRWPWATCPDAAVPLRLLAGMPLANRFTAAARFTPPSHNCTHQFDAAAHAISHAAGRVAHTRAVERQYDCEIGANLSAPMGAIGRNRLWVDGALRLEWEMAAGRPPTSLAAPFDAAPWRGGFMRWADETLDPEPAEHAIVLRRACDIGMGRGMPLDDMPVASDLLGRMTGICYTMQPEIAVVGLRNVGSIRDFAARPDQLLEE